MEINPEHRKSLTYLLGKFVGSMIDCEGEVMDYPPLTVIALDGEPAPEQGEPVPGVHLGPGLSYNGSLTEEGIRHFAAKLRHEFHTRGVTAYLVVITAIGAAVSTEAIKRRDVDELDATIKEHGFRGLVFTLCREDHFAVSRMCTVVDRNDGVEGQHVVFTTLPDGPLSRSSLPNYQHDDGHAVRNSMDVMDPMFRLLWPENESDMH